MIDVQRVSIRVPVTDNASFSAETAPFTNFVNVFIWAGYDIFRRPSNKDWNFSPGGLLLANLPCRAASTAPPGLPPLARSGRVDASRIAALPHLSELPAAELDELAAAVREVDVDAGARVVTADDYGTVVYFIEDGHAEAVTDAGQVHEMLGPGDMFGEIALLLTGQRTTNVVARTPMRLLSLSDRDFQRIRPRVPELERLLRRVGVDRTRR